MESLKALERLSTLPKDKAVDISRVVYAGHSRGGHGALLLGVKLPDLSCGIIASNGWIRREYYADANPIFEHDLSLSHAFPFVVRQIFESSISENDVGLTSENILDIPITIRTCSDDQSVSPWFMRRMARILSSNGVQNLEFRELNRNLGHWWWNTKKTNDGGALFDPFLRKRYVSAFKNCNSRLQTFSKDYSFTVVSLNPSTFHGKHGIRILSQDRAMAFSKIHCNFVAKSSGMQTSGGGTLTLKTKNVLRFKINRENIISQNDNPLSSSYPISLVVDDDLFHHHKLMFLLDNESSTEIVFVRDKNAGINAAKWGILNQGKGKSLRGTEWRLRHLYGPMRRVFDSNFLVVVGTRLEEDYASNVEAATYIANSHFAAQHTRVLIVHDTDLKRQDAMKYNLILVGGRRSNKWTTTVMEEGQLQGKLFPDIKIPSESEELFRIGNCVYNESSVNAALLVPWYPGEHDDARLALIVSGKGSNLHKLLASMSFSSNVPLTRAIFTNMLPDYMVTSKNFQWKGLGGVNAAGYWDSKWAYDERVGFCNNV